MMPLIKDAKKLYLGSSVASKVYLGSTKVWPTSFDPKSIANLTVWIDANDTGDLSVAWKDLSGLGHHGTIVASPPPVLKPNTLNGKPVVRFTVNEGRVRGTGLVTVDGQFDLTVCYVGRMWGANVGRIFTNTYPPKNFLVGTHTSGEPLMYDNGWIGPQPGWGTRPTPWKIYGSSSSGTPRVSSFYVNGVLIGSAGTSAGYDTRWNISGYDAAATQETCDCEVAELLAYDRKLTDTERQQVEDYLRTKWGL